MSDNTFNVTEETKKVYPIVLELELNGIVNYALQQNGIPIIRSMVVVNDKKEPLEDVEIRISGDSGVFEPYSLKVDYIPENVRFAVPKRDLTVDGDYLAGLTEKIEVTLTAQLLVKGESVWTDRFVIRVLAFDQFQGFGHFPEMLCAFVMPNHPGIARITARASELLEKWTGDPSFDGYLSEDPNRVLKQAAAIYGAIQELNVVYSVMAASFQETGQRIRLCDAVYREKFANCMDFTVLYAAALESVGLSPLLLIKDGHIFTGLWLEDLSLPEAVTDDGSEIAKRLADGVNQMTVIESTLMRSGSDSSFDDAVESARQEIGDILMVIDVKRARLGGVQPMPNRIMTEEGWKVSRPLRKENQLTEKPKEIAGPMNVQLTEETPASRMMKWERKLLDLGLRNSLINLRRSKTLIPILTVTPDELEDALSDGKDFRIMPRPADWTKGDGSFDEIADVKAVEAVLRSEFKNHRLRSSMAESDLARTVKELYRSSKSALEENGANTLYLAMGLLKWYESDRSVKPRYAPLLLIPVEIVRKSVAEGYVMRLRDEDPQMNITILEKLRQDFGINVGGLEPLPLDEHGVDVRQIFTIIRHAVMSQKNWDVTEVCALGIFSFSQFVMWNDIKNRSDDLEKNKIVKSLMEGKLMWQSEEMTMGDRVPEQDVYLPLSADGSQLFAIEAANQGESFVLHGPPGTGKSQTITTLIANALAHGQTVLFVAEKMAALSVVQKRLEKIGLGAFCLELHSNKSRKRDLLDQLKRASEVTKDTPPEEYDQRARQIATLRQELDGYVGALHKKLPCGMDAYDLINAFERYRTAKDIAPFSADAVGTLTAADMAEQVTVVQRLIAAAEAVGNTAEHPLREIRACEYSQQLKMALPEQLTEYLKTIEALEEPLNQLSEDFGIPVVSYKGTMKLARLSSELVNWYEIPVHWIREEGIYKMMAGIKDMCHRHIHLRSRKNELLQHWKPDFVNLDATALLQEYRDVSGKWFLAKTMGQGNIHKKLAAYAVSTLPKEDTEKALTELSEFQQETIEARKTYDRYGYSLGVFDQGEATDWVKVEALAEKAQISAEQLSQISGGEGFRMHFCGNMVMAPVIEQFNRCWKDFIGKRAAMYQQLQIDPSASDRSMSEERNLFSNMMTHMDDLKDWMAWNSACEDAREKGLSNVVDACHKAVTPQELEGAYHKAISRALTVYAIDREPILSSFSGNMFNEKIRQFKELDQKLMTLTQEEIYCKLAAKVPDFAREGAKSSELGIIQKAIRSGGRGLSIRKLFEQIPNMLPRLCPCMLMSPLSAAQYLDPNREPFDIVVFDEASQLQTCKAVGALARGKNAVIVGDPKQMPPTSFFMTDQTDEEDIENEDLESILDDCLALNMPQTHLLWHYRSRHESLIAFSNHEFYENKLYTFPSVNERERMVRLVHIDGCFERGNKRSNRKEAEAVIEELQKRCHDPKLRGRSVGVVTFNINQQNLIDDLLTEACQTDTELENWAYHSTEPLFIKNLENVQGDERDVILFSVAYGPDEQGRVSMNFGPLNRDGGWRRLNVAVSRARCEMVVFSTLTPDMIDLSRTSAQGVEALKAFLNYASGKPMDEDTHTAVIRKNAYSAVAEAICNALEEKGYHADRMVGHSEYRIDVAVVDPKQPDRYMLGILLDGGSYRAAKTTRDREVAQIGVLEGLGWKILRVWSMDWWDNPEKERKRIFAELDRIEALPEEEVPVEEKVPIRQEEPAEQQPPEKPVYAAAVTPVVINPYQIAEPDKMTLTVEELSDKKNEIEIKARLAEIIHTEAPVSETLLIKRLLGCFGITRSSAKAVAAVKDCLSQMNFIKSSQQDQIFYWRSDQIPGSYRSFRSVSNGDNKRDGTDIAVEEAINAVYYVLCNQVSLPLNDLIKEAAKLMNYTRAVNSVSTVMSEAVEYGKRLGTIKCDSDGICTLTDEGMKAAEEVKQTVKV